jgi:polyisoprenoid-binding protein YceI
VATFRIDSSRSRLWADARSSLHPIRVETDGLEGEIDVELEDGAPKLDPSPTGRLELDVERLKTGNRLYDRELERRLEVRRYPRLRGTATRVEAAGTKGRYKVRGELSFHGTKSAVDGEVTVRVVDENTLEVEGERTFDMRQFGLEPPSLLLVKVHPDVKIRAKVVARRVS